MARHRDHTGIKYGHLTLISYLRPGGQGVGAVWMALCDCGKDREVLVKEVMRGRVKTCGSCHLRRELISPKAKGKDQNLWANSYRYSKYLAEARRRKQPWALTVDQFSEITARICGYCGAQPTLKQVSRQNTTRLPCNEVDLMVPTLGYTLENSVACCGTCQGMKGRMSVDKFLDKSLAIYRHIAHRLG